MSVSALRALKETKELEKLLLVLLRYSDSCVLNTDTYKFVVTLTGNCDDSIFIGKLKRVGKQVKNHLENSLVIRVNHTLLKTELCHDLDALLFGLVLLDINDLIDAGVNIEPLFLLSEFSVLQLGKVEKIIGERYHNLRAGVLEYQAFV